MPQLAAYERFSSLMWEPSVFCRIASHSTPDLVREQKLAFSELQSNRSRELLVRKRRWENFHDVGGARRR
jgi:hypothetical protein